MFNYLSDQLEAFKESIFIDPNHTVLTPTADTFIRGGGYSKNNYGNSDSLEVKLESNNEDMTRVAFLKFDVSNFIDVEEAILRLYVEFSDQLENRTIAFYDITGNTWSEREITWENAPVESGNFITSRNISSESNQWHEINLTQMVRDHVRKAEGEIVIRIENKTSHWAGLVRFTSKESDKHKPELSIIGPQHQ